MIEVSSTSRDDEANAWVVRMDSGDWTATDEAKLQVWLKRDVRHPGALLQAQVAWLALDVAVAEPSAPEARPLAERPIPSRRLVLSVGGALAASIVGGLIVFGRGRTYSTEVGEITRVPLPDGSTAALNTSSEVTVSLDGKERNVNIRRGEAWFRVAKDAKRPFVVQAGPVIVRAVGTAFSVRRRADGADVVVSEGVVETWTAGADAHKIRLVAGDRAFVGDASAAQISKGSVSAADRVLAWREGVIDLSGETIGHAVEEFNRYNICKIVLLNDTLAGQEVDGIFRTDDPAGFAHAVGESFKVVVDTRDPAKIVIGAAAQ